MPFQPVKVKRRRRRPVVVKVQQTARKRPAAQPTKQEIGLLGRALRGIGGLGGGALGGLIGMSGPGSAAGHELGAAISRWLGAGDYETSQNSIVTKASTGIPMMHKTDQSVVIRHREFICSVQGSTDFQVQRSFIINPGIDSTFPWLAPIARAFQEWELKGAVFHYVPTSGSAISSSSAAMGAVMLQTSYRSNDAAPSSKVELLNEYWASEAVPYTSFVHPLECDPKENPFNIHYVRSGDDSVTEPLMYDMGRTYLATQGMQTTDVVGDLWLTYEVVLKKPLVSSAATSDPSYSALSFTSGLSASAFFDGTPVKLGGNLPILTSGRTITFPVGTFGRFFIYLTAHANPNFSNTDFIWGAAPTCVGCVEKTVFLGGQRRTQQEVGAAVFLQADYTTAIEKSDPSIEATFAFPVITALGANPLDQMVLYVVRLGPIS